jgi:uncharacterized glyoxalase superfamily protein PhnB
MQKKVKAIPEGYHTVTPYLAVKGAAKAIEFYKEAFGAKKIELHHSPDGSIMHAVLKIGDSLVMLSDEFPQSSCGMASPQALKGSTVVLHIYVENADAVFNKAVKAGAAVIRPMEDQFWGDRYGQVKDPFGHLWSIATHTADLNQEEMDAGAEQFFSQHAKE